MRLHHPFVLGHRFLCTTVETKPVAVVGGGDKGGRWEPERFINTYITEVVLGYRPKNTGLVKHVSSVHRRGTGDKTDAMYAQCSCAGAWNPPHKGKFNYGAVTVNGVWLLIEYVVQLIQLGE